jgi:nucleoside-diphosphate-sugar epimerase
MNVLFVGGTGIISSACARQALARGIDLTLLYRGQSGRHRPPPGAKILRADIRDAQSVRSALGGRSFDVVVQWVGFVREHVDLDIELFRGRVRQYVFIGSASAYQTPPARLPVTESTPLYNPFWQYSRDKIDCEERLMHAYRREGFPATVVRPSHTYDAGLLPVHGGWTVVDRMRRGLPVIVHGDGTSLWTLTHNEDFARGFVGLLGREETVGDQFHITSDETVTWDQIHHLLGRAAGAAPRLVHVPSDLIAKFDPEWGASLLGDKAHSMVFDNTKIKRCVPDFRAVVPYSQGSSEQIAWYDEDPTRRTVDSGTNALFDRILRAYEHVLDSPIR